MPDHPDHPAGEAAPAASRAPLFAAVEAEFGLHIPAADRTRLETVGDLVAYVALHHPPLGESLTEEELREHVAAVLGELLAREHGASFAIQAHDAPLPRGD